MGLKADSLKECTFDEYSTTVGHVGGKRRVAHLKGAPSGVSTY